MAMRKWNARTRDDLIIEAWEHLDCESVGARELGQIQMILRETFGEGALASPAAIARTVADEGAVLRHPEVFECDRAWREANLEKLSFGDSLDFSNLDVAFASMVKIEERRLQLQFGGDASALSDLRQVVTSIKKEMTSSARSRIIDTSHKLLFNEVAQWLSVWLQSPELFSDWLDLRRRSPDFRKRFHLE
jgi:hypothetical protein